MDVSYSRDAFHTYMVMDGAMEEGVEDVEKMLVNQHSFALLPFHEQQLNEQKKYYYDISGRMELKSYVEHQPIGKTTVRQLITFILELYRTMEEYLLDPDAILLEPDYLYMNISENTLAAACIPGRKENFNRQLKELAAWLLENADHTDREGVLLVYDFYKIVQRPDFLPMHLQKFGREKKKTEEVYEKVYERIPQPEIQQEIEISRSDDGIKEDVSEKTVDKKTIDKKTVHKKKSFGGVFLVAAAAILMTAGIYKAGFIGKLLTYTGLPVPAELIAGGIAAGIVLVTVFFCIKKRKKKPEEDSFAGKEHAVVYTFTDDISAKSSFFSEDTSARSSFFEDDVSAKDRFFADEKTVVLTGTEGSVRLISMNKHIVPDLILSDFPCTVGSVKGEGQYCVAVEGISRKHALFEKRPDGIFLSDLHSTNGTKVNGEFLEADENRRLMAEDIIEFAGARFMYCQ